MSKQPDLKLFNNNLAFQARDEFKRLTIEIIDRQADRIEMGADSHIHDFCDGNTFAVARHLNIPINPPFDTMDDNESFALIENMPKKFDKGSGALLSSVPSSKSELDV